MLLTGSLAWWCWWKCRADAAVNGLGATIAALVVNHAAALFWLLLAGEYFLGGFGVALAILIALVYAFGCTPLIGSAAWKYFLSFACFGVAISSLLWSSIFNAREDARINSVMNHLRQLGAASQRTDLHDATEPDSTTSTLSEQWEQP